MRVGRKEAITVFMIVLYIGAVEVRLEGPFAGESINSTQINASKDSNLDNVNEGEAASQ